MRFRATCYRFHDPRWAFDPLSGAGAAQQGARFNPPGLEALYLALSVNSAILEIAQGFAEKFRPCTLVCYEVDCEDIVDLRTQDARARRHVDFADLACAWKLMQIEGKTPPTWDIVRRLRARGTAGILVPSFAAGADPGEHRNLVLWDWTDTPPHRVAVFDPDRRLPRDQKSWPD